MNENELRTAHVVTKLGNPLIVDSKSFAVNVRNRNRTGNINKPEIVTKEQVDKENGSKH